MKINLYGYFLMLALTIVVALLSNETTPIVLVGLYVAHINLEAWRGNTK